MTKIDERTIPETIAKVLADHADQVATYRQGKLNSFGFLFGQAMKVTDGQADARLINRELQRQLA